MTSLIRKVSGVISPAAALFGIYLMLYGESGIGGGFAGGVVLASSLVLYVVAFGRTGCRIGRNESALLSSAGAMFFIFCVFVRMINVGFKDGAAEIFDVIMNRSLNISIGTVVAFGLFGIVLTLSSFKIEGQKDKNNA
jgi:multisubunit Na+/H+ antiporter MnhB subunit